MTEGLEEKIKKRELKRELLISVFPFAILGLFGGAVSSYVLPQLAYAAIKDTKELFQRNFNGFHMPPATMYTTFFGIYLYQIQKFARNLIEEPKNPMNYIPLATNLIGGLGFQAYSEYKDMEKQTNRNLHS